MSDVRIGFAGDRDIAVRSLRFLVKCGVIPKLLLISDPARATHASELLSLCPSLPDGSVMIGGQFRERFSIDYLKALDLDYLICVHFPYLVPSNVLDVPKIGVVNLHPAYLPYNRGWHTPTWAILDGTPYGATLHFMDESIDTGDIILQRQVAVTEADTANSLYQRVKEVEYQVFCEAWPLLESRQPPRIPQSPDNGTVHTRRDLFVPEVQQIQLGATTTAEQLLRRLRALTTNDLREAAFFDSGNRRFRVQVSIHEEPT